MGFKRIVRCRHSKLVFTRNSFRPKTYKCRPPPPNFFTKLVRQKRHPTRGSNWAHFYKFLHEVCSFGQNLKHCSGTRNTHRVKKHTIFVKKHIFLWDFALTIANIKKSQKRKSVTFPLRNASRIMKFSQKTCLEQLFSLLNSVFPKFRNCNFTLDRRHQN